MKWAAEWEKWWMGEKTKTSVESIGRGICFRKGLGHRKVWRQLCRKVDFVGGPRIHFHGIAWGWVRLGGSILGQGVVDWVLGFVESIGRVMHIPLDGWRQLAATSKITKSNKQKFLEIQKMKWAAEWEKWWMGEKTKTSVESIGRGICFRKGLGHRKVWRQLCRKVDFCWWPQNTLSWDCMRVGQLGGSILGQGVVDWVLGFVESIGRVMHIPLDGWRQLAATSLNHQK